jgi:hypothetical protein
VGEHVIPRLRLEHAGSLHELRLVIQTSQRTFGYFMSEVGLLGHATSCQVRLHQDGLATEVGDLTEELVGWAPHEDMGTPPKKQMVGEVGCDEGMHAQRNAQEMA